MRLKPGFLNRDFCSADDGVIAHAFSTYPVT